MGLAQPVSDLNGPLRIWCGLLPLGSRTARDESRTARCESRTACYEPRTARYGPCMARYGSRTSRYGLCTDCYGPVTSNLWVSTSPVTSFVRLVTSPYGPLLARTDRYRPVRTAMSLVRPVRRLERSS